MFFIPRRKKSHLASSPGTSLHALNHVLQPWQTTLRGQMSPTCWMQSDMFSSHTHRHSSFQNSDHKSLIGYLLIILVIINSSYEHNVLHKPQYECAHHIKLTNHTLTYLSLGCAVSAWLSLCISQSPVTWVALMIYLGIKGIQKEVKILWGLAN